jgi:myo-inositol 2-dehydrogenase/D-chiro-inositol 1-dehydrogenase
VVVVKFDNGAIATAEANFSAVYGYDVRAEVFGSAGMVSAGDTAITGMTHHTAAGRTQRTVRGDVEFVPRCLCGRVRQLRASRAHGPSTRGHRR